MSDLLAISDLAISFDDQPAVRGIDLSIGRQETHALVGESGSGKSATALSILRLNPPYARTTGRIAFEGEDLLSLAASELRRLRGNAISMIFQEPMVSLNPVLTVGEQIGETLRRHRGLSWATARKQAIELLDLVRLPDPAHSFGHYPHHLSGGQRQRVMIAIAIACRPKLLIADEPTTSLDVTIQAEILDLLDALKRELSMSLLLITHDLGVVGQWSDRVSVMHAGRIVESGSSHDVLRHPRHPYTQGLLGASLHLDDERHYSGGRLPEIRTVALSDGSYRFDLRVPTQAPTAPRVSQLPAATAPILAIEDVGVTYRDRSGRETAAVEEVSFSIAAGETLGLVGESGCGKSSLAKAILRLLPFRRGRILVAGTDISALSGPALQPYRSRLQLVFQDPYGSLNPRQSVFDMLDLMQRLRGVSDRRERLRQAKALIDQVGLPASSLERYPHEFSGGQRQRIGIARALIQKPNLIICDEPVSALDVSVQAQILNLLSDLKDAHRLSYLFISHDLGVVRYFADRIIVMKAGRIVEEGRHDAIWSHATNDYTRRLIASVPRPPQGLASSPDRRRVPHSAEESIDDHVVHSLDELDQSDLRGTGQTLSTALRRDR